MTLVVLDTSAVRAILQNENDAVSHWPRILLYSPRATFRLSDTAIAELSLQLAENRLEWESWNDRIHLIDAALDGRLPVESCNRHLGQPAKEFPDESIPEDVLARRVWRLMKGCRNSDDLNRPREFLYEGITTKIQFTLLSRAQGFIETLREQWAQEFDESLRLFREWQTKSPAIITSLEQIVRAQGNHLDDQQKTDPPMSKRFDAWIRNRAERVWSAAKNPTPYNPRSEDHSGDALDDHMLQYLSLPEAHILTQDGRFARRMRQTNSSQSDRIISLEQCHDLLARL